MTPEILVGLLAEPTRMRVFAAIVLGASNAAEIRERTGLTVRQTAEAVRRLTDGGLIRGASLQANIEVFKEVAAASGPARVDEPLDPDRERAAVLRAFIADGKLVSFPAAQSKRRIILEHVVSVFEPGVRYSEREVNAILRAWHADHVTLRRYLVDADLMNRDQGFYWRIGGPMDL
jgi:hypothetical protein